MLSSLAAPGVASAATGDLALEEPAHIAAAVAQADETGQPVLVESETTEYAEVRANPDGTLVMTQSLTPERVTRDGNWEPLDLTLARRPDGTVGPKNAFIDVRFTGASADGTATLAVMVKDGREVGIGWTGELPEPQLDGATATYSEVLPDVDLALTAKPTGFTQVLIVKSEEAAQDPRLAQITFPSYGKGVIPRESSESDVEAVDESGTVVFRGNASWMWDSRGKNPGGARASETEGDGDSGPAKAMMDVDVTDKSIVVRPDQDFLTAAERVFPIYIDPEYWWTGKKQGHVVVQSKWPDARNYNRTDGDLADLKAGYQGGYLSRSFFDFDVRAMQGKYVHRASVRVRVVHSYSCKGGPTELWHTGAIGYGTTWNNQPSWRRQLDTTNRSNHAVHCPSDGRTEFKVDSLVREAAEARRSEVVFGLKARNASSYDWRRFSLDPVLEVVYNTEPSKPTDLGMESGEIPCITGGDRPFLFTPTPRLRGKVSDPDGGSLTARFVLYRGETGAGTQIWTTSTSNIPSGSYAEVTVPGGLLAEEGTYHWSMSISDGDSSSSEVGKCEFAVDHTAPDAPVVSSTDYPNDDGVAIPAGGVGQTGVFTFDANGTEDVDHYLWSVTEEENDDPQARVDAEGLGGNAAVRWTPALGGPQTMFVRSVDRAGNRSDIVRYRIFVRAGEPLVEKLEGHWQLDGDLADHSSHNRDLIAVGEPQLTADGYDGGAVRLDGASSRLYYAGPVLDTSTSFSVSAWAKASAAGGYQTVLSQNGQRTSGFQLQLTTLGEWALVMFGEDIDGGGAEHARIRSPEPASMDVWTHLLGVYDHGAGELRLYVDGRLVVERDYTSTWTATGDLQIGAAQWKGNQVDLFDGVIDDVRVYQRVIVPSEAELLANHAVLRAHYPLDEGTGTVATDRVTGAVAELAGSAAWESEQHTAVIVGETEDGGYGEVTAPQPGIRTDRSYTVAAWVRLDDPGEGQNRTAVSVDGARFSPFMLQYRENVKKWCFLVSLGADIESGLWVPSEHEPEFGRWVHLTGVHDFARQETRIYVNGSFSAMRTGAVGWNGDGELVLGGARWIGQDVDPWNGAVRNVRVYSGVLSDQTIGQLPLQS